MLLPGTRLRLTNEVWTVVGPLPGATGGFGDLYIVRNDHGDVAVAKLVEKDPGADRELLIGAATQAAGYSNVIPVLDHGEHGNNWVLVMPRADTNLADYLVQQGQLSVEEVVEILHDVATALADINNQLVHRDIKPQNILLLEEKWCLADFGIARYAAATTAPDTRKYSLTAQYAAPEQWRMEQATSAADVYAFGVVAYQLLTGQLPFPGPDFRKQHLNDQAHPLTVGSMRLRDLVEECLYKPPETRPTPTAILKRLEKAAEQPMAAGLEKLGRANRDEGPASGGRACESVC